MTAFSRRRFLQSVSVAPLSGLRSRQATGTRPAQVVQTVTGPVNADRLGVTLTHEHLFSTFGANPTDAPQYDEAALLAIVTPYLAYLRALGCRTIADATAIRFGRHGRLLHELSRRSGVQIVTNTGIYGAANDRYVPPYAEVESAEQIGRRWVEEVEHGIDGIGIRPGFVKIGVDAGPLSALDRKLVLSGALAHRATGLTLAVHTGDNPSSAHEQLSVIGEAGVDPSAWIWVHASACRDDDALWDAAGRGAWLGLDSLRAETLDRHLALLIEARRRRLQHRVLLSHDGNAWPANDAPPRPFDLLLTTVRPRLRREGWSEADVQGLLIANPAAALGSGRRLRVGAG